MQVSVNMQLLCSKSSNANFRSLVCDNNGIVIAETVYRCMICAEIFDVLDNIQKHYQLEHFEERISSQSPQNEYFNKQLIDYENYFENGTLSEMYTANGQTSPSPQVIQNCEISANNQFSYFGMLK